MAAAKKQFPMYEMPEETPPPEEDEGVLTQEDLDAVGEDDPPPDDEPPEGEPQRLPRKQRRQQRLNDYNDQVAAREEAERRLEAERVEKRELLERIARVEGATFARQQPPQADPNEEFEKRRDKILEEQDGITQQWNALPEEEKASRRQEFVRKFADKEDELTKLRMERFSPRVDHAALVRKQEAEALLQANEDILTNPEAKKLAMDRWEEWKRAGKPTTPEAGRLIFASVRRDMGMPGPFSRRPSEQERSRYTGIAGRGGGKSESKSGVRLNEEQRKMAIAYYSQLPKKEAYAKFYKEVLSQD